MRIKLADQPGLLASLLLHLRAGQAVSRTQLAEATGLSPSTIGIYVDHLMALGFVEESGLAQGPMGRPKRRLGLVPSAGWFVGVEFNAERVQAVKMDFAGGKLGAVVHPLADHTDTASAVRQIIQAVRGLGSGSGPLLGLGIGVPGLVDSARGIGLHYSFISDWRNVPLGEELARHFPVKITLENNLRAIALAERWFGSGKDMDDYVILGPRRGFGVAIVKEGQLIRGGHHAAGEIGRWPWPLEGRGGELHDRLTAPAVWARLSGQQTLAAHPGLPTELQALSSAQGDAWQEVVEDYGRVIGMLHLLLDAQAYFLHGPLTALGTRFCDGIRAEVVRLMPGLQTMPPRVIPSTLGDEAGALGAACLAMESWLPSSAACKIN